MPMPREGVAARMRVRVGVFADMVVAGGGGGGGFDDGLGGGGDIGGGFGVELTRPGGLTLGDG